MFRMASFVSINVGSNQLLVNLDCSVKHILNYLEDKYSEWENDRNRHKSVAEQAIARIKASNTILMSVSRKPKGAYALNLDECLGSGFKMFFSCTKVSFIVCTIICVKHNFLNL